MKINRPFEKPNSPLVALVATPIGNIEDITLRALNFLRDADIIACEDTRVTSELLNKYSIKNKKLVSLYSQTEIKQSKKLIEECKLKNLKIAYCTDAGMPGISDPGALLVQQAYENDVPVTIFPGVSASLSSLVISNIDTADFSFFGFLPTKDNAIANMFEKLSKREETLIFYQSLKRIKDTLIIMKEKFLPDRKVAIVRELTKIHEEVLSGTIEELLNYPIDERGECVIVVEGYLKKENSLGIDESAIRNDINMLLESGCKVKVIARDLALKYDVSKKLIYNIALSMKENLKEEK